MLPERVTRISLLFDLFGPLLTERQRQVVELAFNEDLSLGEIAVELNISRQGVHDLLRRAEAAMEGYEDRLRLAERVRWRQERLRRLQGLLTGDLLERDGARAQARDIVRELLEA